MPWMNLDYFEQRSAAEQQRILRTHLLLGTNPNTGDGFFVPDSDRYAGMHVIGVQGYGKSSLLESLIHDDIASGRAVIVIDPHGDLADHCLAALPQAALERTSVLDMADENYPFGANLFSQGDLSTSVARDQAVQRLKHVFEVFWPEVMQQQYAPQYLHYATRVLLDNPGTTLYDLRRFLRERTYREHLLKRAREPQVAGFWREFNQLKPDTQESRSRPLLNRWQFLTSSPLLRNIICQPGAIDFRKAIAAKQVLFIKLPTTTMAETAGMVGTILLGQITAALFSFGDLPEAKRPGFSLFMDEFQHFAEGPDIQRMFSEGRKFGVRLVIANQRLDQLPATVQAAVESARTKVVFRVTPSDARKLAQHFPQVGARPKPEDIHPYPCDYLLSHTHLITDPGTLNFVQYYLLPLQGEKPNAGQVLIRKPAYQVGEAFRSLEGALVGAALAFDFLGGPSKSSPLRLPDPTPYLDQLLREAMAFDNPLLPIPPVVVRGLANSGDFFSAVRNITEESPVLRAGFTPPQRLIRVEGDGWEVVREPESPSEWLAHCVFFLRHTMAYLAEHPLGNVKETGASEIAQKLARLPQRVAFVRGDDDFGPIRTLDAPEPSTGDDLEMRRYLITRQSRERYCRPREDVEAAFTNTDEPVAEEAIEEERTRKESLQVVDKSEQEPVGELPDEPAVSRWEL